MCNQFLAYRIKSQITHSGEDYNMHRKSLNPYGEEIPEDSIKYIQRGIFHVSNHPWISLDTQTSGTIQSKRQPMLLVQALNCPCLVGDILIKGGTSYRVNAISDLGGWGIVLDLSLEIILGG